MSDLSTGDVMTVVTMAINTIIANSVGEMIPRSRPMLSTISSISPRVFIRMPRLDASRHESPMTRGGGKRAAEFSGRGHGDDRQTNEPLLAAADEPDLRAHAGEGKKGRQEQRGDEALDLLGELPRDRAVVRNDGAEQKRAEDCVHADRLGRQRRDKHADQERSHQAWRQVALRATEHESSQHGADDEKHQRDVGQREHDDQRGFVELRLGDADHEC